MTPSKSQSTFESFDEAMVRLKDRAVMYTADWDAVMTAHQLEVEQAVIEARLEVLRDITIYANTQMSPLIVAQLTTNHKETKTDEGK